MDIPERGHQHGEVVAVRGNVVDVRFAPPKPGALRGNEVPCPAQCAAKVEQAHFTGRLRMASVDRFEEELTIEDPEALTEPWTITIRYERVTDLDRMVRGLCDENHCNPVIAGKLTIEPAEN